LVEETKKGLRKGEKGVGVWSFWGRKWKGNES